MRITAITLALLALTAFCVTPSYAFLSGFQDITLQDGLTDGSGWSSNPNEDNETEPGTVETQDWDAEGFRWDSSTQTLYLIAGFDFAAEIEGFVAGDLFLTVNGTEDYVVDLVRTGNTFTPVDFSTNPQTADLIKGPFTTVAPTLIGASNPFAYASGGTDEGDVSVQYYSGLTNAQTGYIGKGANQTHYALAFDLSALGLHTADYVDLHWTMECGNDMIKGRIPAPEPTSLLMACAGVFGVFFGRRKLGL